MVAKLTEEERKQHRRESSAAYARRRREEEPERVRELQRKWYAKNPDYRRKWLAKNRERANTTQRLRRAANPERSREYRLKIDWGLSSEEYERLLRAQNGGCAICGRTETATRRVSRLAVDHCHVTGRIRGLLCGSCNRAIGLLGEDPKRLERAAQYLR